MGIDGVLVWDLMKYKVVGLLVAVFIVLLLNGGILCRITRHVANFGDTKKHLWTVRRGSMVIFRIHSWNLMCLHDWFIFLLCNCSYILF